MTRTQWMAMSEGGCSRDRIGAQMFEPSAFAHYCGTRPAAVVKILLSAL